MAETGNGLGGEGANEGFWRFQIRDRWGQWVEMGGNVTFDTNHPNFGRLKGHGTFTGGSRPGYALIKVEGVEGIKDGTYEAPSADFEAVKAIIKPDSPDLAKAKGLDAADGKIVNAPTKVLKLEVDGEEGLTAVRRGAKEFAKSEGRFPVVRDAKDVMGGARLQYKSIYPQMQAEYPELLKQEGITDADSFAQHVIDHGLDSATEYKNSIDEIPPIMKAINKVYAREFLGLDPENGFITYYRNAVNHHDTIEASAPGYASLDKKMAWDYNAYRIQYKDSLGAGDGRYKIRVKPEEVYGHIGYTNVIDEYGVVIGPYVTNIPGRVERVGDLEIQIPAPWNDDSLTFPRANGDSPWRHNRTLSQFDIYPVEEDPLPGTSFADFKAHYGLEKDAIANKYKELYGIDGNEAIKNAGLTSTLYSALQSAFTKFVDKDGKTKWGFNPRELDGRYRYKNGSNAVAAGDQYDTVLKLISSMQELTGKPFMVARGEHKNDPRVVEAEKSLQTGVFQEYGEAGKNAVENTPLPELGFDPEEEITIYRGVPKGIKDINPGDWVTTLPQLARDYAGDGDVVTIKVKAKDLLADPSSGEGAYTEEMVYRPTDKPSGDIAWDVSLGKSKSAIATKVYDAAIEGWASLEDLARVNKLRGEEKIQNLLDSEDSEEIQKIIVEGISGAITDWNGASFISDDTKALQSLAAEIFKLENTSDIELTEKAKTLLDKKKDAYTALLKSMYAATQKYLSDSGITEVTIYRGYQFSNPKQLEPYQNPSKIEADFRPLSSWSTDPTVASKFVGGDNGIVMKTTIPASQVFSLPMTGFGVFDEREVVVLGAPESVVAVKKTKYKTLVDVKPKPIEAPAAEEPKEEPKVFDSMPSEVYSWLDDGGPETLISEQKDILNWYQGDGAFYVNSYLRDRSADKSAYIQGIDRDKTVKAINYMDNMMSASKGTPSDAIVYRTIRSNEQLKLEDLSVGSILNDPGFLSTSVDNSFVKLFLGEDEKGFIFKLTVPKGTKAITPYTKLKNEAFEHEKELLLERDSNIEITNIDYENRVVEGIVSINPKK